MLTLRRGNLFPPGAGISPVGGGFESKQSAKEVNAMVKKTATVLAVVGALGLGGAGSALAQSSPCAAKNPCAAKKPEAGKK